jgi:hypothetical protein
MRAEAHSRNAKYYRAARGNARPGAMPAFLMQHQNFNTRQLYQYELN